MVLEFFGINVAESELRAKLKTKPFGTHVINVLLLNTEHYGIEAALEFLSLKQLTDHLEKQKAPCIATVWTGFLEHWSSECSHAVVVHGFDNEHIIINDPNFDEQEFYIPFDNFLNAWQINDGLAIIFRKRKNKI